MKNHENFLFLLLSTSLVFSSLLYSQERFIDVRQKMADQLTRVKNEARLANWSNAQTSLAEVENTWLTEVKPLIIEEVKKDSQYLEYFNRLEEVEMNLNKLKEALRRQDQESLETLANATIWAISHHPRGFKVPPPRYSIWDWVFALTIGLGFCALAIWFGLYLRRSYYRRFPKGTFTYRSKP